MLQSGDAARLAKVEADVAKIDAGFKAWIIGTEREIAELKKSRDAAVDAVQNARASRMRHL